MPEKPKPTRIVIMGAAGRDFHNFNSYTGMTQKHA